MPDATIAPKPMILLCGKYGSGKSTAAKAIHARLPLFDRFDIDETRQRMGLVEYRREDTPYVLERICQDVELSLRAGNGVIVDRPHQTYGSRALSYDAGMFYGRPILIIETVCPEELAKARISHRPSSTDIHLPANDPSIYERIKRRWVEIETDFREDPELFAAVSYVRFDTSVSRAAPVTIVPGQAQFVEGICRILESAAIGSYCG